MNGFAGWLAGWGAGFLPAMGAEALALATGRPETRLLAVVGGYAAVVFGTLGASLALFIRDRSGAAGSAALCASVMPAPLALLGLLMAVAVEDPVLWLGGVAALFLPGPIAAAVTAWIRARETHGTS